VPAPEREKSGGAGSAGAGAGDDMSGMDFNKLAEQAMKMQQELQRLQEEAAEETVTASAGGGTVKVTATAGGEITKIEIDPKAIDPDDPELLADVVTAAVNEALRSGRALLESKVSSVLPEGLGGHLPGM
jgi:DNA-binding YbaB/EbfC family protein